MSFRDIDLTEACAILAPPRHTLILMHANPDGDTAGSAFALKILLEKMGSTALCLCKAELPDRLRFLLYGQDTCEVPVDADVAAIIATAQRVVAVDIASPSQLGHLREPFTDQIDLSIDHHMTGEAVGPRFIDANAAASGELIFDIAKKLQLENEIGDLRGSGFCERVYAAISSDTGCFKYSSVTPATHRRAAALLETGIDAADINRRLFDSHTQNDLRALQMTLENMRYHCNGRVCSVLVTRELLNRFDLCDRETGNIVDIVRSINGVEIGFTVRQTRDDPTLFRVSSRTNTDIDLAAICAQFGGGGHIRAAGCSLTAESPEQAYETMLAAFTAALSPQEGT